MPPAEARVQLGPLIVEEALRLERKARLEASMIWKKVSMPERRGSLLLPFVDAASPRCCLPCMAAGLTSPTSRESAHETWGTPRLKIPFRISGSSRCVLKALAMMISH